MKTPTSPTSLVFPESGISSISGNWRVSFTLVVNSTISTSTGISRSCFPSSTASDNSAAFSATVSAMPSSMAAPPTRIKTLRSGNRVDSRRFSPLGPWTPVQPIRCANVGRVTVLLCRARSRTMRQTNCEFRP